jgi:hypothetical protein
MRIPRVRLKLGWMMILIVFVAMLSALVIQSIRIAQRDRELARLDLLLKDYSRAADRLGWAERMYKKGYVSKAVLDSERIGFDKAGFELLLASPGPSTGKRR